MRGSSGFRLLGNSVVSRGTGNPGGVHVPGSLRKGGRTADQAGMALLSTPAAPPASADYIFGKYLVRNEEWVEFISGW